MDTLEDVGPDTHDVAVLGEFERRGGGVVVRHDVDLGLLRRRERGRRRAAPEAVAVADGVVRADELRRVPTFLTMNFRSSPFIT